jgi:hypothetical protein
MTPLVPETPPHRRRHRRQNAQFFGCFDFDVEKDKGKDTATPTNVISKSFPNANNTDINTDSIVCSGPQTSPRQHRPNAHVQATTTLRANHHCSGDGMHVNKDTNMAMLDNNSSSDLMQWRFSKRYLTNNPVSPHNKDRHTCSLGSSGSSNEDGNDEDLWAQGVTQLSQLYANGRYKKQRGEIIAEDYYFRNDEGTWNHLEWHSRQ